MRMTHTYQIQYIVTTDPRVYYGHPVVGRSPTIRHGLLRPTCSTFRRGGAGGAGGAIAPPRYRGGGAQPPLALPSGYE